MPIHYRQAVWLPKLVIQDVISDLLLYLAATGLLADVLANQPISDVFSSLAVDWKQLCFKVALSFPNGETDAKKRILSFTIIPFGECHKLKKNGILYEFYESKRMHATSCIANPIIPDVA